MAWAGRAEFRMLEREVKQTRRELAAFRREHLEQHAADLERHQTELASRSAARRWQIGLAVAAVGSLWAPLLYLMAHLR